MPDINNTLATQVQPPQQQDPTKMLSTLSQLELARAHAGLYGLQAQQQARQLNALQAGAAAYNSPGGGDAAGAYLGAGGDPAGAVSLQNVQAQRDLRARGGGLLPAEQQQQAGAAKDIAETNKTNAGIYSQIGGVLAQYGREGIPMALSMAQKFGVPVDPKVVGKIGMMDDAGVRMAGKQIQALGVPAAEATKPFAYTPGQSITTPGNLNSTPTVGGSAADNPAFGGGSGLSGGTLAPAIGKSSPTTGDTQAAPPSANGPQPIIQGKTPAQVKEEEGLGDANAEQFKQAATRYAGANSVLQNVDQMTKAADELNSSGWSSTGSGNATRIALAKGWNGIVQSFGLDPNKIGFDPTKIAASEDLNKLVVRAGQDLSKQMGSREAAQIVQQSIGAVQNPENSPLGFKTVTSSIRQGALRDRDYFEALANKPSNQTTAQAEIAFNQNNPPSMYANRAILGATVPQGAIDHLIKNPSLAPQFNEMYGKGKDVATGLLPTTRK